MKLTINGVEVEITPEQWERLKSSVEAQKEKPNHPDMAGAEKWLRELISNDLIVKLGDGEVSYYQSERLIFKQDLKNKWLWVGYYSVWSVLQDTYNLTNKEIRELCENVLRKAFNYKGITPLEED